MKSPMIITDIKEEQNENKVEADTIASVDRVMGKSTLPLILDDPVTPLREYDKIHSGKEPQIKKRIKYG